MIAIDPKGNQTYAEVFSDSSSNSVSKSSPRTGLTILPKSQESTALSNSGLSWVKLSKRFGIFAEYWPGRILMKSSIPFGNNLPFASIYKNKTNGFSQNGFWMMTWWWWWYEYNLPCWTLAPSSQWDSYFLLRRVLLFRASPICSNTWWQLDPIDHPKWWKSEKGNN